MKGDPDTGDPDIGDPDMGDPDTGDLGMLAAGEHPPVPAGDRFARILRSELDFPGLLAATLDARKEEDARNAGQ